jgi:hypothetical protein
MDFGDMSPGQQTTFASPDVVDGVLQNNKHQFIRDKILTPCCDPEGNFLIQ